MFFGEKIGGGVVQSSCLELAYIQLPIYLAPTRKMAVYSIRHLRAVLCGIISLLSHLDSN